MTHDNQKDAVTPRQAMEAQGRMLYYDEEVLAYMPQATGETVELFNLGRHVSDDELEKEYLARGLQPASPYDVAAMDEGKTEKSCATHWKDSAGRWCFAAFDRWDGGRVVDVSLLDGGWGGLWWFAGVRNGTSDSAPEASSGPVSLELGRAIETVKEAGYVIYKQI